MPHHPDGGEGGGVDGSDQRGLDGQPQRGQEGNFHHSRLREEMPQVHQTLNLHSMSSFFCILVVFNVSVGILGCDTDLQFDIWRPISTLLAKNLSSSIVCFQASVSAMGNVSCNG